MQDYELIEIACQVGGCTPKEITSKSMKQQYVDTRALIYALLRKYRFMSDENIAMLFNRKPFNVSEGIRKVKRALINYQAYGITSNLTKICLESKLIISEYEKL